MFYTIWVFKQQLKKTYNFAWFTNRTNSNPKSFYTYKLQIDTFFFLCVCGVKVKISFWGHYAFGQYILITVNLIHVIFNLLSKKWIHSKSGFKQVTWLKKKKVSWQKKGILTKKRGCETH